MDNTKQCEPGRRCGNWKTCDRCARIRQKRTADKAEAMSIKYGQLYLSVMTPHDNTATAMRRMRAALLRKQWAPAGIWTIETGEDFQHLHLNLITPEGLAPNMQGATIHQERITTTPRAIAAYITKRKGAPTEQQFDGRLLGTWGQIGQIMATEKAGPIIQAAALNDLIATPHTRQNTTYFHNTNADTTAPDTTTPEQYRDIARRHLSALYAAAHRNQ